MEHAAKLFMNGRSQAVRLPAAYRFKGKEVFIRKNEATGEVILSGRPTTWTGFLACIAELKLENDVLGREENHAELEAVRDPFEGWQT